MGFLDKVKRVVRGPVEIVVDAPQAFSWADGRVPVEVTLRNTTDAPLQVAEVRVELSSGQADDRSTFTRNVTLDQEFTLAPGASETRSVEVPLQIDTSRATMQSAVTEAGLPAWVGSAASAAMGPATMPHGKHQLAVVVKLAGSSRLSSASTSITAQH